MNGHAGGLAEAAAMARSLAAEPVAARVAVCPPATLIERVARTLAGTPIEVGAQDCRPEACGAYTGDVCAEMLYEAGARIVILGHSERRAGYRESDADVAAKVRAALRAGLEPIVCVGESLAEREAGVAAAVVRAQVLCSLPEDLAGHPFAVAYEPIWAIGTGLTPTVAEIEAIHREIRRALGERAGAAAPILYGGLVKPSNAAEILHADEVGGALVGGASLAAGDFLPIVRAAG
jgi:triosephosphate isomerase